MSETLNTITAIKKELLMRLGHDADIFALISLCTREPYVVCDEETFDDEVFLFLDEEEAKRSCKTGRGESTCYSCQDQWKRYAGILYRSVYTGCKCPGGN